ncbi:LPXTG-site transpeptidase family protein [hydrothermal vent metagenome]|uniref:LPXTG-site transpeptidase family protein n=1 Tax=hydrothermal vent metagenome TaxID=652676 RepID=A0A3B0YUL3_9ZZZZ
MAHKLLCTILFVVLLAGGLWQIGQSVYIYTKAELAQTLILNAWQESIRQHQPVKPWSWADTWPVARLMVSRLDVDLVVLAGDNGRTLAFGPGHRFGSPFPGEIGNSLIAGHRDTHFRFLKELVPGEEILVQTKNGEIYAYRVNLTEVIHESTAIDNMIDHRQLTLVTCYPFESIVPGGPLRYVVYATEKT